MIPKKVYYCWFGNEKPPIIKRCIDSWHRVLNDYEIIEVNESWLDMNNPYVKDMVSKKRWAFLSDYMRLKVLKDHPGIYMDTDVYMIKPFSEDILNNKSFLVMLGSTEPGCGVIGVSSTDDYLISSNLKLYDNYGTDKYVQDYNTHHMQRILRDDYGLDHRVKDVTRLDKITLYPREYCYPMHWSTSYKLNFTDNTFAFHIWTCSPHRTNNLVIGVYKKYKDDILKWFHDNYPDSYNDIKLSIDESLGLLTYDWERL